MIPRRAYLERLKASVARSPVTALLGPRQSGKTTLARQFADGRGATFFDLESARVRRELENPEFVLGSLEGLVVLDEIQLMPELFSVLRILVDRPASTAHFLILGSASPAITRGASQSLAGRIEFVELTGFSLGETGPDSFRTLWRRGSFPRSFLASSEVDSVVWREAFIRTFLERDIPQLGVRIPPVAMRRFWTMLAHWHGRIWNASALGRALGLSDKTVRSYLDLLSGTYLVRKIQPWFENVAKRQVKAPKVCFRETGLLHTLLSLDEERALFGHPAVGPSWEGFVIEQVLAALNQPQPWFWAAHSGGALDLMILHEGRRVGFECKFSEAPALTRSLRNVVATLDLAHLFLVCPTDRACTVDDRVTILPAAKVVSLEARLAELPPA